MLEMQKLTAPHTPTVSDSTFSQISVQIHMKKNHIQSKVRDSGSISKRKYFSSPEIREAFFKEVTSELGPKVKAVLVCSIFQQGEQYQ